MLLGDILHPAVITTALAADEKYAAIRELLMLTIESGDLPVSLREDSLEGLYARERSMSTGMEHGVALPHASSERVDRVIGALGVSREGIPWECLDCEPARLIILLLLPRHKFQVHVRTLAGISHVLNDNAFCESLIEAAGAEDVLRLIHGEERRAVFDDYRTV